MGILCRLCTDARVPEGELIAYLDAYVASLTEDERVDEATYRQRLRLCAACPHLAQATCRLCGCYVQARAAKKRMDCPLPGTPAWTRTDLSERKNT